MTPSKKQIGTTPTIGKRIEPTLCAVSGRPCQGKPHVTHYGPNGQFVYVLAQYDHLWNKAAPAYGFSVTQDAPAADEGVFVLSDVELGTAPAAEPPTSESPAGDTPVAGDFASLRPVPTQRVRVSKPESDTKDGD